MAVRNDAAACRQPIIATGADGLKCSGGDVADVGSVPEITLSRTNGTDTPESALRWMGRTAPYVIGAVPSTSQQLPMLLALGN